MVDIKLVSQLREMTGAGLSDCQEALTEANGNLEKAQDILRQKGEIKAAKKIAERQTKEGIVYAYVHSNQKVGALLELFCETDFVARTEDFKKLANDLGLQIAAMAPEYLSPEQVPAEIIEKEKNIYGEQLKAEGKPAARLEKILEGKLAKFYEEVCLLKQPFIKDDKQKVEERIKEVIAKTGEKIEVGRFIRYQI